MNIQLAHSDKTPALNRFFQQMKRLIRRNREIPLRYCLLLSPILISVLIVGFIRYFYGRLTHQF